ncbi:MAG TPA: transglutaminase family protein [Acidimicrobiales bacterium]|nr:transglutaminase family protein [Acidimicrobiales bacterium]
MSGAAGRACRLLLRQTLRYDYPSPVGGLRHRLMVLPPARHGDQMLVSSSLEVRGAPAEVEKSVDRFGNVVVDIRAPEVQQGVEFVVEVAVERREGAGPVAGAQPFLDPTPLTEPDGALAAAAGRLAAGEPGLDLALRINGWVASALRYRHDVTTVRTTAAETVALGQGVCQDHAHVMLALCRLCGLPARYVSGHLVGEGGSHAWVEVLLPSAEDPAVLTAVAFDPTNDRRAGRGYLTVAVGRDYADVAPTSGSYVGPPGGRLTASKSLEEEVAEVVPA